MRVEYQPGTMQFSLDPQECERLLTGARLEAAAQTPTHQAFLCQLELSGATEPHLRLDHDVLSCHLPAAAIKEHAQQHYPDALCFVMAPPGGHELSLVFSVR